MIARLLLLWGLAAPAAALELGDLAVAYRDGRLSVDLTAVLDAPPQAVWRVAGDYDRLHVLIPAVVSSRRLPSDDPSRVRVEARLQGCVWVFCTELDHVMAISEPAPLHRSGRTLPALSEFRGGRVQWSVAPASDGTRLAMDLWLEPDIWIPPLIGPYLIERRVRRELQAGLRALEAAAAGGDGDD